MTRWQLNVFIGGVLTDAFGRTSNAGVHDLGDGWDRKNELPLDKTIAVSDLSYGSGWPRTYYYIVALSVSGTGLLYEFLDKVVQKAREEAVKNVTFIAGENASNMVGYIVDFAIDKLWNEISRFFQGSEKFFNPITVEVNIPAHGSLFNRDTLRLTYTGHGGKYQITLGFEPNWIEEFVPAAISKMNDMLDVFRIWKGAGISIRSMNKNTGWS